MNALFVAAVSLAVLAGQAASVSVEQIGSGDAGLEALDALQLGERTRRVDPAEPSPPEAPPIQFNTEPRSQAARSDQPYVAGLKPDQAQFNTQPRSAEPPQGPDVPFPKRTTLEAVSGDDRCDPRQPDAASAALCQDRIEQRAAEFAPPPPREVSLEERLMADQDVRGDDAAAAARRLAAGGVQSSAAAQAYVFTNSPPASPPASSTQVSAETQRAIDAAAQIFGVLPPNAVVTPR